MAEEEKKEKGFIKEAVDAAEKVAQAGLKVERLKDRASHAVEDGIYDAKRLAKRTRYAAEDFVDETAHYIKQDPLRSIGVSFGIGFGLGAIVGLLLARKR